MKPLPFNDWKKLEKEVKNVKEKLIEIVRFKTPKFEVVISKYFDKNEFKINEEVFEKKLDRTFNKDKDGLLSVSYSYFDKEQEADTFIQNLMIKRPEQDRLKERWERTIRNDILQQNE